MAGSFKIGVVERECRRSKGYVASQVPRVLPVSFPAGTQEENLWFSYESKSVYHPIAILDDHGEPLMTDSWDIELEIIPPSYILTGSTKQTQKPDTNTGVYWFKAINSFVFGKIKVRYTAIPTGAGEDGALVIAPFEVTISCDVDVNGNAAPPMQEDAEEEDSTGQAHAVAEPLVSSAATAVEATGGRSLRAKKENLLVLQEMSSEPTLRELNDGLAKTLVVVKGSKKKKGLMASVDPYAFGQGSVLGTFDDQEEAAAAAAYGEAKVSTKKRKNAAAAGGGGDEIPGSGERKKRAYTKRKPVSFVDEVGDQPLETTLGGDGDEQHHSGYSSAWGGAVAAHSASRYALSADASETEVEAAVKEAFSRVSEIVDVPTFLAQSADALEYLEALPGLGTKADARRQLRDLLKARRLLDQALGRFLALQHP